MRAGDVSVMAASLVRPFDPQRSDQAADLRAIGALTVAGAAVIPLMPDVGIICPLRRITGIPCPFCGMTTGTLALGEGDVVGSIAANPAAIVFVLAVAIAFVPAIYRSGWFRAAWVAVRPLAPVIPMIVLPLLWLWELNRFALI